MGGGLAADRLAKSAASNSPPPPLPTGSAEAREQLLGFDQRPGVGAASIFFFFCNCRRGADIDVMSLPVCSAQCSLATAHSGREARLGCTKRNNYSSSTRSVPLTTKFVLLTSP
jgi:hypothetical protein